MLQNPRTRRLALDVMAILLRLGDDHGDGLEAAVDRDVMDTAEVDYWAHSRSWCVFLLN